MARSLYSTHEDVLETIGKYAIIIILIIPLPIVVAFFSGLGAMICGWVFEDTIRGVWLSIGVDLHQYSMFQIGVALGFVGGFLKSSCPSGVRS